MQSKETIFPAQVLENARPLFYSAWTAAGEMTHNAGCIENMGPDPHYQKKYDKAAEELKSAWLAIEATGIMPALFADAAAKTLDSISTSKFQLEEMSHGN